MFTAAECLYVHKLVTQATNTETIPIEVYQGTNENTPQTQDCDSHMMTVKYYNTAYNTSHSTHLQILRASVAILLHSLHILHYIHSVKVRVLSRCFLPAPPTRISEYVDVGCPVGEAC